jgi:type IV pilus assembly protein PilY1
MHTKNDIPKDTMAANQSLWQHSFGRLFDFKNWSWPKRLLVVAIPCIAAVSFVALSTEPPPSIPAVTLSADPLYTPNAADKPTLVLGLSVEFPTVGAQYLPVSGSTDATYSNTKEYLGYYDAESCYNYNKAPTETPTSPLTTDDYKRFDRSGPATNRQCTGETFSGNFLNWSSSSAIDMLRLALTGGDRYIDTPTQTVLQRAVLPHDGYGYAADGVSQDSHAHFWNSTNFPGKQLLRSGGASGTAYFGAVPVSMRTTAAASSNDIWIVNDLNKIYFGTAKTGTLSTSSTSYTLGTTPPRVLSPAVSSNLSSKPSGFGTTACNNGSVCSSLSGLNEIVVQDTSNTWDRYVVYGAVTCNSTNFPGLKSSSACYTNGTAFTPTSTYPMPSGLTSDGFFYARVQVCDRDPTTYALNDVRNYGKGDHGLCQTYSDGLTPSHANYKPIGVIQAYSDQLRLAAFGYLMDQVTTRVGGVLRAPMKYVGAKTFDISGVDNTPSGGNPKMEWNQTTGVFNANPEGNNSVQNASGTYLSGIVNYVNQFGRTGPVPGRYKIYDPFSELHYESLRYLQGLPPSSAAITGLPGTTNLYDGFPAYTSWSDPYGDGRSNTGDYACLKSNIVMIGDKNTNEQSGTGTGNSRFPSTDISNNLQDFGAWSTVVQNFEKNVTTASYVDGQGVTRSIANPNGANNSVPTGVKSMVMGSAYWARTHDIRGTSWTQASTTYTTGAALRRPGLRVKTFMFDVNEFSGSTDPSVRQTSNQLFMAAKYGGFETDPSNVDKKPYNTYGNPFVNEQNNSNNNAVWQDAARAGDASTYFMQSDARNVLSAFDDIFARSSTAARSIAGGAIQSKNLTQVGSTIYQGTFDTSDWTGDLLAIPVNVSASNVVSIGGTTNWTAAARLAALTAPATSRNIVVGEAWAAVSPNPVAVSFTWATVEQSLKDDLNKPSPSAVSDGLGEDRLNYLRGDKSKEGSPFRSRSKLMGDVINSGVVYSGAPTTAINDTGYASFYATNKSRTPAVFVGANDGMLHAFNANNGDELFAYIPSWLGSKLSALTNTSYNNNHQSYLDGTPAVAEAQVGSDWKTVLVSGTGGGGKGVFALDVTNPATFTAANVMWEFTNNDDADLGNVTGRPKILKMRTGANTYKWFAVFGSGVNNYVSQDGVYSTTGNPALFILDLSKAAGTAWALGTNYFKISLPVDSTVSTTMPTGLLNFSAALGLDKAVTNIFMGDLHGNLWKLDFAAAATTAKWTINDLSYFKQGTSNIPIPMFIAKDTNGKVQPISVAPSIAFGPVTDSYYVLFGTGKYLETGDKSTTNTQSMYMVYDNGTTDLDSTASTATSAISDRLRLKLGTADAATGVITVPAFTVGRAANNTQSNNPRSGWVADFPNSGERQISNGTIYGEKIVFGSLIPAVTSTTACSASGGGGNQYTLDILSGNGTSVGSSVGILGEPLVEEISSATSSTANDSTGRRTKTITSQVFQQGSNGIAAGSGSSTNTVTRTVITGRLTWRQINNYQDLKNAP